MSNEFQTSIYYTSHLLAALHMYYSIIYFLIWNILVEKHNHFKYAIHTFLAKISTNWIKYLFCNLQYYRRQLYELIYFFIYEPIEMKQTLKVKESLSKYNSKNCILRKPNRLRGFWDYRELTHRQTNKNLCFWFYYIIKCHQ